MKCIVCDKEIKEKDSVFGCCSISCHSNAITSHKIDFSKCTDVRAGKRNISSALSPKINFGDCTDRRV